MPPLTVPRSEEPIMILLAVLGGALVAAGLAGLFYCIAQGYRIRGAGLEPAEVTRRLRGLLIVNMASVGAAGLGLAMLTAYFVLS
jgi:hypothetical protein